MTSSSVVLQVLEKPDFSMWSSRHSCVCVRGAVRNRGQVHTIRDMPGDNGWVQGRDGGVCGPQGSTCLGSNEQKRDKGTG